MSKQHPLTDEIISKQFGILDVFNNEMDYDEDDMRSAADWQLKQCEYEVTEMLALLVLSRKINREELIGLLETFKSHMRPTATQEDPCLNDCHPLYRLYTYLKKAMRLKQEES